MLCCSWGCPGPLGHRGQVLGPLLQPHDPPTGSVSPEQPDHCECAVISALSFSLRSPCSMVSVWCHPRGTSLSCLSARILLPDWTLLQGVVNCCMGSPATHDLVLPWSLPSALVSSLCILQAAAGLCLPAPLPSASQGSGPIAALQQHAHPEVEVPKCSFNIGVMIPASSFR